MPSPRFALIGAAGFVAPRHLAAIRAQQGDLLAALDPNDSVGILDSYFPQAAFFTEFERFDRHLEKEKRAGNGIDYLSVCSPNYLHDAHCRFGLRLGADVICEKPLVLNPWNLEALAEIEAQSGKQIFNILQLRLHPSVQALRQLVAEGPADAIYEVDLTYLTARGSWYYASWKGDVAKSGGIATNIGIHFFDMLLWVFGPCLRTSVHYQGHDTAAGFLQLQRANIRWLLSIDASLLPKDISDKGGRTYRALHINDQAFEFSGGFDELHNRSYEEILAGRGFGLSEVAEAITLAYQIRNAQPQTAHEKGHPLLASLGNRSHPFQRER